MDSGTATTLIDSRSFTTIKIKRRIPIAFLASSFGLFYLIGIFMIGMFILITAISNTFSPAAMIGLMVFDGGCSAIAIALLWKRTCRKYWQWFDANVDSNNSQNIQQVLEQCQQAAECYGMPSFTQHSAEWMTAHYGIGRLATWLSKRGFKGNTLQVVRSKHESLSTPTPFETSFPPVQLSRFTLPHHRLIEIFSNSPNRYPATPESVPKNFDRLVTTVTLGAPFIMMAAFLLTSSTFPFPTIGLIGFSIPFAIAITWAMRWFFWRTEWHIIPGGVVIRETSPFIKGWDIHALNPSEGVLTYFPAERFLSIATDDGQYWARPVSNNQAGYLLRAWQMAVVPPTEAELADFG